MIPASTLRSDITKINLATVHVRSFFRLPVSRNLDAKGLCCVLRRHHSIHRRPLRQVLGSSLETSFRKSTCPAPSAFRKIPNDKLNGVCLSELRKQNIKISWAEPLHTSPRHCAVFPSILNKDEWAVCRAPAVHLRALVPLAPTLQSRVQLDLSEKNNSEILHGSLHRRCREE